MSAGTLTVVPVKNRKSTIPPCRGKRVMMDEPDPAGGLERHDSQIDKHHREAEAEEQTDSIKVQRYRADSGRAA